MSERNWWFYFKLSQ